ncbi:MAG: dipeptide epimerase [Bacteriovoracaceae bacterium]|nr:dipeptide epimerase [Bacteriovoracaceae bacterium]
MTDKNAFTIERKKLPLLYPWKIARGETLVKENFIVKWQLDKIQGMGEVAPSTRYGETHEQILKDFDYFLSVYNQEELDFEEFSGFLNTLEIARSLRFGLESTYIHTRLRKKKIPVHTAFNLDVPKSIKTSFSIPIMELEKLKEFVPKYSRYKSLKIKVDAKTGLETLKLVSELTNQPLRIDANEAWTDFDNFMKFLFELKEMNVEFIEQPFPANCEMEYEELKKKSPYPIIADESVTDEADFDKLANQFHGINVKLMKAGGYINAIYLLKQAKKYKMKTMLGCMIETTLGISSAIEISSLADYLDLDGFLHLQEDPYKLVTEKHGQLFLSKTKFT